MTDPNSNTNQNKSLFGNATSGVGGGLFGAGVNANQGGATNLNPFATGGLIKPNTETNTTNPSNSKI
jgi:hypothetical protein